MLLRADVDVDFGTEGLDDLDVGLDSFSTLLVVEKSSGRIAKTISLPM